MKNITLFAETKKQSNWSFKYFLLDIDDTLTTEGQLHADAYNALWDLKNAGYHVIPITGRPAGWCEMIARFWPVDGVVGENGGLCFYYMNQHMHRWFHADDNTIKNNTVKLKNIEQDILKNVKTVKTSSDQFCRLTDLAIDFCEDIPRAPQVDIEKVKGIFETHGATAKISSIHVNGWLGSYNKLSTTLQFIKNRYGLNENDFLKQAIYIGDSPNDEPMFKAFPVSIGVANVLDFKDSIKYLPTFITNEKSGNGFSEAVKILLSHNT